MASPGAPIPLSVQDKWPSSDGNGVPLSDSDGRDPGNGAPLNDSGSAPPEHSAADYRSDPPSAGGHKPSAYREKQVKVLSSSVVLLLPVLPVAGLSHASTSRTLLPLIFRPLDVALGAL